MYFFSIYFKVQEDIKKKVYYQDEYSSLCKIVLNVEYNDDLYEDEFIWDIKQPEMEPEQFIKVLCDDIDLCDEFKDKIVLNFKHQIDQFNHILNIKVKV